MSQQIQITGGAKVRNLEGVITGSSGVIGALPINASNGIPQLDVNGKILVDQLPNSIMEYKGTWDAATNTPTLANGTGNAGDVYLCNVAGTTDFGAGPITFAVGDQVLYSGTTWEKASGATGTVTSVAVTESGDALTITGSPITTSGTINIGFAGTGSQYIKGDGTLATFPTTIDQAKRLITEVYNSTGATLTKGTVVYINGGQGNLPTITKAQANADNTSAQTYGVVQSDITNMNNGFVVVLGSLTDLDTQAYSVGTQLYLSGTTAGEWTSTKPSAPIHLVYVGIVVRSHPTQGVVEIRIQNGYELEELHDVAITSVANNDGIFYNSSNNLWENKTIDEALGYTPANDSLVVHLAGTETITGAKTFSASLTAASTALFNNGILLKDGASSVSAGHFSISSLNSTSLAFQSSGGRGFDMILPTSGGQITIPNGSGTLALTSDLSSYVPYTGATTNVNIGNNLFTSSNIRVDGNGSSTFGYLGFKQFSGGSNGFNGYTSIFAQSTNYLGFSYSQGAGSSKTALFASDLISSNTTRIYNLPDADGTIALTSNLSSYLPLSGGTLTGNLTLSSASTPLLQIVDTTNSKSLLFGADDTNTFIRSSNSTPILFQVNGGDTALTLSSNSTATFASDVFTYANGGIFFNGGGSYGTGILQTSDGSINLQAGSGIKVKVFSTGRINFNATETITTGNQDIWSFLAPNQTGGALSFNIGKSLSTYNNAALKFHYLGNNSSSNFLGIGFYDNDNILNIKASGNVGVGTTAPTVKLHSYSTTSMNQLTVDGAGAIKTGVNFASGGTTYGQIYFDNNAPYDMSVLQQYSTGSLIFGTNNTERMRITSGGNVVIGGTTAGTSLNTSLTVNNSSAGNYAGLIAMTADTQRGYYSGTSAGLEIGVSGSGYLSIWTASTERLRIANNGLLYSLPTYANASGSGANVGVFSNGEFYRSTSSLKYKKNVENYTKGLAEVMQMRPVTYNSINEREDGILYAGLIAEEVHDLGLTEFVQYAEDGSPDALAYQNMVSLLVKAIQELNEKIKQLENK